MHFEQSGLDLVRLYQSRSGYSALENQMAIILQHIGNS